MSKILYNALGSTSLKDIVNDVQKASMQLGVDFFGVGALARNVWYVSNDENPRGTKDVDFGVYVSNSETYNKLKNLLIEKFSYVRISTNAFCLMSPYGIPLDLLPFGEIEKNGKVLIEGKGLVTINLDGFFETYSKGLIEIEIEENRIKICSIPSVVLLKLIAYDDRPSYRLNDPIDIDSIIRHYPKLETEMIWAEYSFLYNDDSISHEEIGIKVLGYELSKVISENETLISRVISILDRGIELKSELAESMIQDTLNETIEGKVKNLKMLRKGVIEGLKK